VDGIDYLCSALDEGLRIDPQIKIKLDELRKK
jgi:hypothetical protein